MLANLQTKSGLNFIFASFALSQSIMKITDVPEQLVHLNFSDTGPTNTECREIANTLNLYEMLSKQNA